MINVKTKTKVKIPLITRKKKLQKTNKNNEQNIDICRGEVGRRVATVTNGKEETRGSMCCGQ